MIAALAACALALASPAGAQALEVGAAAETIRLDGAGAVVLFGSAPATRGRRDIAVELIGPARPRVVRRKARVAGAWINRDAWRVDDAPGYLARAQTARAPPTQAGWTAQNVPPAVADALNRDLRAQGLALEGSVAFVGPTLFRAVLPAPANAPLGLYRARFTLFEEGRVVARAEQSVRVKGAGASRAVARAAREAPLVYGLAAVMLAALVAFAANLLAGLTWRNGER